MVTFTLCKIGLKNFKQSAANKNGYLWQGGSKHTRGKGYKQDLYTFLYSLTFKSYKYVHRIVKHNSTFILLNLSLKNNFCHNLTTRKQQTVFLWKVTSNTLRSLQCFLNSKAGGRGSDVTKMTTKIVPEITPTDNKNYQLLESQSCPLYTVSSPGHIWQERLVGTPESHVDHSTALKPLRRAGRANSLQNKTSGPVQPGNSRCGSAWV